MHRGRSACAILVLLGLTGRAAADGVNPGVDLDSSDWAKLIVVAVLVLVVVVVTLVKLAKGSAKAYKEVRRELSKDAPLPTATVHRDGTGNDVPGP